MNIYLKILVFVWSLILVWFWNSLANNINFTMSPIVYELTENTGSTITKTAKIRNNGTETTTLYTEASDFEASGKTWQPKIVRYNKLVHPDQKMSPWITIDQASITLAPNEEKWVTFSIDIPSDATPGWHYGAVCFKNPNPWISTPWTIWVNLDYCILIILKVNGEVIVDGEVTDVEINVWWPWAGAPSKPAPWLKDKIKDFIASELISPENTDIVETEVDENTSIWIKVEFENKWNTHIKPEGKIEITDEDGNTFKKIGKKIIVNEAWAIIWEEIVDYIPVNEQWGNVLPQTTRDFETEWQWFPYEWFDENGQKITKYKDLWEYYTERNMWDRNFLMFWEKEKQRENQKKLTANIKLTYQWSNDEDIEYSSAEDFYVSYTERYIGYNWRVMIPLIILSIIFSFWFIIAWKRRKDKEEKLEKKIREKIHGELIWKTKKEIKSTIEEKVTKKRWRPKKDS